MTDFPCNGEIPGREWRMRRRPCRKHRKTTLQILSWRESATRIARLSASAKPARDESFTHRLTSCSSPRRVLAPCWRDSSGRKCSHSRQGTISSALRGERDYHTVVHLSNPRGGTGRFLRCFFLRVGTDRSPQDDLAALHLDRDPTGIRLRIAHQRLLDLRLQILWYRLRLDREKIADSSDAGEAFYSWFGISLLEVMIDLALQRHPALTDRHINFASWNSCIPPQGVEHSSGEIGIGAFCKAGQAHLDIVSYRQDAKNAVRSLLRCGLFQVRIDPTRQGNDAIFDHYPHFVGLHVCIPLQLFQHISLSIYIRIETHCHMRVSFPCLSSFFIFADETDAHCQASGRQRNHDRDGQEGYRICQLT